MNIHVCSCVHLIGRHGPGCKMKTQKFFFYGFLNLLAFRGPMMSRSAFYWHTLIGGVSFDLYLFFHFTYNVMDCHGCDTVS